MFHENWATYQNPRGCVSPFKTQKGDDLNPKLAAAMEELNKYPEFTDLFFRVLPSVLATEGRTMGQSIYIDMTPEQVISRMTKTQNDWFETK